MLKTCDMIYLKVLLGNKDQLSMTWPFEDVLEIHKRWYELTDTALEIFLTNGKTCLLALRGTKVSVHFQKKPTPVLYYVNHLLNNKNLGPRQIESICRQQIQCCLNDDFSLL